MRCRTDALGPCLATRAAGPRDRGDLHRGVPLGGRRPTARPRGPRRRGHAGALTGVGQRGLKNDVRDARTLSEASCRMDLPSVHIPTVGQPGGESDLCLARGARSKRGRCSSSRVRSYVPVADGAAAPSHAGHVARESAAGAAGRRRGLAGPSRTRAGGARDAERADCRRPMPSSKSSRPRTPACALMTVPGVGPVTSARFVAALDDVERFPNASSVASYLGLVPGENTTGFRTKRTRLTRAGAPQVRWALGQAAWSLYLRRPRIRWCYGPSRSPRGGAARSPSWRSRRKLAHVLYALWKHETAYDPARGAAAASRRRRRRRSGDDH